MALMAELRTSNCSAVDGVSVAPWIQYDAGGAWHALRNPDGSSAITTNGRHQFLLGQNPDELDPALTESPPVGKRADYLQLRLDLRRGANVHQTPVVVFAGLHAIKTTRPLRGWQFTIDVSRFHSGLTPWGQRSLLLQLMQAGESALLHFAHLPAVDGPAGSPDVRPVKLTRFSGLDSTGLQKGFTGRISVMVSEVVMKEAPSGAELYGAPARGGRPRAPRRAAAPHPPSPPSLPSGPKGPRLGALRVLLPPRAPRSALALDPPEIGRGFPDPPEDWQDSAAEWAVYWAHTPLGRGPVGQTWLYQTPFGGSFAIAGFVPDFLELDLGLMIDVIGRSEASEADPRATVVLREAVAAHLGALYLVIDEAAALADPIAALRRALAGISSSQYQ